MTAPIVFLSYSYDSEEHKNWVRQLASDLRARGIDATLDQWDLAPGQDIVAFMERGVTASDRVLLICTERYVDKAERGDGGVGYERLIVSAELVARIDTKKFVPLVKQTGASRRTPVFLGPRRYIDFSIDLEYETQLELLAREIHGVPATSKPLLGANPYTSTVPPQEESPRLTGPSGLTAEGRHVLSDEWFEKNAAAAAQGLAHFKRKGAMELRFALHNPIRKSQLDLLGAVRQSAIHTFGWPLGVILDNRDEYRPRPVTDGIRAELAFPEDSPSDRASYDYWAARMNGDFYLLQSLFEDGRKENVLFFNTRIVRVTEALMFASKFYESLGASSDSRLSVAVGHRGLAGRTLGSSSSNRYIHPRQATEDASEVKLVDTLANLRSNLVDHVMQITEPMFMLFDFARFERSVYEDIVQNFVQDRVT